jgi:hypothetical protein
MARAQRCLVRSRVRRFVRRARFVFFSLFFLLLTSARKSLSFFLSRSLGCAGFGWRSDLAWTRVAIGEKKERNKEATHLTMCFNISNQSGKKADVFSVSKIFLLCSFRNFFCCAHTFPSLSSFKPTSSSSSPKNSVLFLISFSLSHLTLGFRL